MLGGTVTSVSGDASSIATISSTNSGLPSAAVRIRSRSPSSTSPASSPSSRSLASRPSGSSRTVVGVQLPAGPARPAVEQLRARHAQQQDRCVARPVRDVLDQVEEGFFRPVQVVPHDDERALARGLLEQTSHRERDLFLRGDALVPEHDAERPCDARIELALLRPQLLHRLDERPVRDALAVGEAPAAHHGRVDPAQELRDEARLADAGDAEQREELAREVRRGDVERLAQEALLALASDEGRVERPPRLVEAADRDETKRVDRLRLALERERLDRLDVDRRARELHRLCARRTPRRAAPPARAAPRR